MNYYPPHIEISSESSILFGSIIHKNNQYLFDNNIIENNRAIHNDIVYIQDNKVINIKERNIAKIAGILYLNKNTKYGFNSKNMPYYVFKPLNKKYPKFLVASSIKNTSKNYIVISFNKWPTDSKYPYGKCEKIIGPIGNYENECEILLYKHNLVFPKFKIHKSDIIQHQQSNSNLQAYDYNVFSIDPPGCKDIDDAISFHSYPDYIEIGVHITDVSYYINDLQHLLTNLPTSVYCLHKQINMIPDIYATDICSLLENTYRKCVSVIYRFSHNYELLDFDIKLTNVYVMKNLSYDDAELYIKKNNKNTNKNTNNNTNNNTNKNTNKDYSYLSDLWNFITKYDSSITDTHILIEKLMVLTNHKIADTLYNYDKENTILRTHNNTNVIDGVSCEKNNKLNDKRLQEFLKLKTYQAATYEKNVDTPCHYGLDLHLYTHFTSPIRRLSDIITHINIKKYLEDEPLLEIQENEINHINNVNKSTKKLGFDYKIIELLYKFKTDSMYKCEAYIIDFNKDKLKIYIPEFNIEYKIKYYNDSLVNLYTILEADDYLEIIYENEKKKYKKMEKINIEMYFVKDSDILEDKIKIKFI